MRTPTLALLLILAACGNHGRTGQATLGVAWQSPTPGSIAEPGVQVALAFDRALDPASLTSDVFVVADGDGPLPGSFRHDVTSASLVWVCEHELPRGSKLTARVAQSVRGQAGAFAAGARSWTFTVRDGVAKPPVTVRGQALDDGLAVTLGADGRALLANGGSLWPFDQTGLGAAESTPFWRIAQLRQDQSGAVAAVGVLLGHPGSAVTAFARRAANGTWSPLRSLGGSIHALATFRGADLHANVRGDVLLRERYEFPSIEQHQLTWGTGDDPSFSFAGLETLRMDERMHVALDDGGNYAVMRDQGEFVLVQRHEPTTTGMLVYTVAQGVFFQSEALLASGSGALRAIWHEPGVAKQSFAQPHDGFGEATTVPVHVPTNCRWLAAPSGAVVGWFDDYLVRSEAGSAEWTNAGLPVAPLAAAISPRGEAVFVYFRLPDEWWLVRWRAGEVLTTPVLLANLDSPFHAARSAAVAVDAAGRVVALLHADQPADLVAVRVE